MKTNLKKIRLDIGFTQHALAEELNVMRGSYSNYETGKRPLPIEIALDLIQIVKKNTGRDITLNDIYVVKGHQEKPKRGGPKKKLSAEKALREMAKILSEHQKVID